MSYMLIERPTAQWLSLPASANTQFPLSEKKIEFNSVSKLNFKDLFHDAVLHLIPVTLHKSLNFSTQVFGFSWRCGIQQFLRCCCILAVIYFGPLIRLHKALKVMTFELDIAGVPVGEWLKFTMYPTKNEMFFIFLFAELAGV